MPLNRFYFLMLLVIVSVLGYLNYQIVKPFLSPLVWAIVLSTVFYPLYAFLSRFIRWKSVSSLVSLTIIIVIILGPVSYLSFLLAAELKHLSDYLESGKLGTLEDAMRHPYVKALIDRVITPFGFTEAEFNKSVIDGVTRFGKELVGKVTKGIGDVLTGIVDFVFMAFAVFFFLRDGPDFLQRARDYMPFSEAQKERLVRQIRDIVISTIYGGVAVAMIQGVIGGTTFSLLGISSPILWGFAISVASFIPLLGCFAVWGPAVVILFVQGAVWKAIALAIVGTFVISLIDNFLRPIIIGGRTKMPILVIFFSVIGGIKFFGLIGLIMGPLVVALFVSVIEIFRNLEGGQNA